jgi:hypothetical protein
MAQISLKSTNGGISVSFWNADLWTFLKCNNSASECDDIFATFDNKFFLFTFKFVFRIKKYNLRLEKTGQKCFMC